MRKYRKPAFLSALIAFGMLVSGCAGKPEIVVDPALREENAGEIFVYRPSSHWGGLAIDYRVTVDDQYIGSLKTGGYVRSFAAPGDRVITVQPHFLSFPDGKPGTATITAEAGARYYLRLSPYIDDVIITPYTGMVLGHLELHLVSYEDWEQRL